MVGAFSVVGSDEQIFGAKKQIFGPERSGNNPWRCIDVSVGE
jgi:hypothetical protein